MPGTIARQTGHVIDIMPTLVELAEGGYPAQDNGKPILPVEGKSLVPVFRGDKRALDRALFWEHEGNRAVRQGEWKLVSQFPIDKWELYHVAQDPTELRNLSREHPAKVRQLTISYEAWAERAGVVPWEQISRRKLN